MKMLVVSWKDIIKLLTKKEFSISRQSGSHIIMIKKSFSCKNVVVIPRHNERAKETLLSIISQSGINREDFLKSL